MIVFSDDFGKTKRKGKIPDGKKNMIFELEWKPSKYDM